MVTHANLTTNATALRDTWRITAGDVLVHALPVFHVHGLFVALHPLLLAGATILMHSKFDPRAVLADFARATLMMGVPTFYTRLLAQSDFTADVAKSIRLFISGSAPLAAATHREFAARTGHAILERYGMTETNMNTSNPYDGERVPGSVGLPLPGTSIRIADPASGKEVATGEVGQIEIKGPNVFKGYWRSPEKTKAEFRADGYFMSGDLGFRDEKGYVHIVGRNKDLIISGGFNVYPAEVEWSSTSSTVSRNAPWWERPIPISARRSSRWWCRNRVQYLRRAGLPAWWRSASPITSGRSASSS